MGCSGGVEPGHRETRTVVSVLRENKAAYYNGLVAAVLFFLYQLFICGLQQITKNANDFPAPILAMLLVAAVTIVSASRSKDAHNVPRPLAEDEQEKEKEGEKEEGEEEKKKEENKDLLASILVVGFPVSQATGDDTAMDAFFLLFLWTGTLAAQATVKTTGHLRRHPRGRTVLAACLNAVLWSSLGTIAYTAAKVAVKRCTVAEALAAFDTGTTLADLIRSDTAGAPPSGPPPTTTATMGAGDLATSVLNAGIVSWGLKLFECRAQLLSRAGLTALAVGSVFALANVVCGPLLVKAMGLAPASRVLAFAARSVTLALGEPAVVSLGGDTGLNATMVVFNGIVFQVGMGLGVGGWPARLGFGSARRSSSSSDGGSGGGGRRRSLPAAEANEREAFEPAVSVPAGSSPNNPGPQTTSDNNAAVAYTAQGVSDVEKAEGSASQAGEAVAAAALRPQGETTTCTVYMRGGSEVTTTTRTTNAPGSVHGGVRHDDGDDPNTVAAGMAVGINAAAMGTAYFYENGSRAAPYAALSMTVFGVMTVVFTSVRPLASWLVASIAE
ncbi:LrgB-like protein [Niveomyces insectorum RCEF 264]|uniref:LrgB-like protein n=1 Tax=Niveomyces insectorum RCEF 264 TaxID=1081102 RepID=A0A167QWL4_9HYPO|nr:LrgB-like protein [Niveomyces insectorum RCEF 264]